MSPAAAADLSAWAALLRDECPPTVPLAASLPAASVAAGAGAVYADASGDGGFCAWTLVDGEVLVVGGEWTEEEQQLRIEVLELLASTIGLVTFAQWLPRDVVSYSDNVLAVSAMRSLRARSAPMQRLLARRVQWLLDEGRTETALRVTSRRNVWADVGSRPEKGGVAAVAAAAAAAGYAVRVLIAPREWRSTDALCSHDD